MSTFVAYYRVSTDRQGKSGIGLEGQRAAVLQHIREAEALLAEYTEVETGKLDALNNCPELRKALAHAKRSKAVLIVAKFDRLTRSVAVMSMLHQAHVEFVCCDNPHANRLTIQIFAVVAEDEARRISDRTKAALAAYKARGGILGASLLACQNMTPSARLKGSATSALRRARLREEVYGDLMPRLRSFRSEGRSLRDCGSFESGRAHDAPRAIVEPYAGCALTEGGGYSMS